MITIKRALLSVYDKTGLDVLARSLISYGVSIIATQSTHHFLKQHDLPSSLLSEDTGYPEMIHGRVKTLHPRIFSGILARSSHGEIEEINSYQIPKIDLVVVNLYPFIQCSRQTDNEEALTDEIDIGGVALLRAAAKNFRETVALSSPEDYEDFLLCLNEYQGSILPEISRALMKKTFFTVSQYDWSIFQKFSHLDGEEWEAKYLKKEQELRYGENPHQKASYWLSSSEVCTGKMIMGCIVLQGKELSYNNLLDISSGLKLMDEFSEPSCIIIKHTNPCGVSSADKLEQAYLQAYEADPVSAFGGIYLFNRPITPSIAQKLVNSFIEIILAPSFDPEALTLLSQKKNLRLLHRIQPLQAEIEFRSVYEGQLQQESNTKLYQELNTITGQELDDSEQKDLIFGLKVVKHLSSNAIVIVKNLCTCGIGMGQANRVQSTRLALEQAKDKARGAILVSDGFLPFDDTIIQAAQYGVSIVVEPGGSIRDQEVINSANQQGIRLVFTGMRHFKH